jgi:3-hydroxyisobutyrate dehydrogenase-like beta-hydroxyacid dehydrogenase
MANLTFLGTGLIGGALAEAAALRGDRVTVWNRTRSKAEALAAHGATVAASAAEAVRGAERVHLALPDDAAIDGLLDTCGAALDGAVLVDHSTASPAGTAARAARLEARGIRFLHAPVFMSPAMCRSAGGLMLAAGPRPLFDQLAAALGKMTGKVQFVGERRDLAAAYKLFGNAMIITITAGLADVYGLAAQLGIPAGEAHAFFAVFNPTGVINFRGANMAKGNYAPSFELAMARKDARLVLEAAAPAQLAVLPAVAARMDELIARGHGHHDLGVLAVDAVPPAGR